LRSSSRDRKYFGLYRVSQWRAETCDLGASKRASEKRTPGYSLRTICDKMWRSGHCTLL